MVPCVWLECSIRLDALFNIFRFSIYDWLDHLPHSFDSATCSSFTLFEALVDRLQFIVWFLISFLNQSLHRFDCLHLLVWRVLEVVASNLYVDTLIHRHESSDFLLLRGIIPLLDWRLSSLLDTLCLWFGLSLVQYFQVMLGLVDRYFSVFRFCEESLRRVVISKYVFVRVVLRLMDLSWFVLQTRIICVDEWNRASGWVLDVQSFLLGHLRRKSLVSSWHYC